MRMNAPAATGDPSTSDRSRQAQDGREAAHTDRGAPRQETTAYVLENAVVVAEPDHTRIEAPHGTEYGDPLPPATREALAEVARNG